MNGFVPDRVTVDAHDHSNPQWLSRLSLINQMKHNAHQH